MALKVKTEYKGIDKGGTTITVKDVTGLYSPDNLTGYGLPNLDLDDINSIIFTLSAFAKKDTYSLTFTDDLSITDIVTGKEVTLTAENLAGKDHLIMFEDGVYDLNEYVTVTDEYAIDEAKTGEIYIKLVDTLPSEAYLNHFDSVVDQDGNIYQIDKTKPFNSIIIPLTEELTEDVTDFYFAYRANDKFLNTRGFDYNIAYEASKCGCSCDSESIAVNLTVHKMMANIMFERGDYASTNKLISEPFNRKCC